jgi:hypothetical protein
LKKVVPYDVTGLFEKDYSEVALIEMGMAIVMKNMGPNIFSAEDIIFLNRP